MKRTGNPFVDLGLCAIVALTEKESIGDLTIRDMKKAFDSYDIVSANSMIKSFTMVFTNNTVLGQPAYKKYRKEMYRDIIEVFLENMKVVKGSYTCEICGNEHNFDINNVWNGIITRYGYKPTKFKILGRDFFPLVGSLGNDAQALPSASRAVSICPICLFAVNYIPISTMLIKGRLVCIESTSETLMLELIKDIVHENKTRISAGNREIFGKKEGSTQVYAKLLKIFSQLQRSKRFENLPETTAIYLWLFSNSGTGADCDIIEIPNKPLRFIWKVSREPQGFKNEFLKLIANDKKGRLFDAINYGEDYPGLYPKGKYKGVIPELYEYYQRYVVGKSAEGLEFSRNIALKMLEGKDRKSVPRIQKSDVFKDEEYRNMARRAMVQLVLNGQRGYDDYLGLFNRDGKYLHTNQYEAYNSIMYYLYNNDAPEIKREGSGLGFEIKSKNTDKKIKTFAELYFHYYVEDPKGLKRGIERFKKDILDRFKEFNEFKLKDSFARISEVYDCDELRLDYDGWLEFTTDEDGNRRVYELLFQLRLAFAELYREYNKKEEKIV
jgi:hypothetical protein